MAIIGCLRVYRRLFGPFGEVGGGVASEAAFYSPAIIVVAHLFVWRLQMSHRSRLHVIPSASEAPPRRGFRSSLSHLKQFHKSDYTDNESITFQLLLVQDAKMKLEDHVIVGDVLHFSFITGMERVTRCRGAPSLNQAAAVPGGCGCAAC